MQNKIYKTKHKKIDNKIKYKNEIIYVIKLNKIYNKN